MKFNLDDIKKPVNDSFELFRTIYHDALESDNDVINEAVGYIRKMEGKQMRPLLVLLSAGLHGQVNRQSAIAAALIELTHTASLVHDDVVDEAYQRRNMWSVNALWRSKAAVLIGDYMLSRGINLAVSNGMHELLGMIGLVIEQMSKGELMQSDLSKTLTITMDQYFEIVRCKTATLLSSAAAAGAITAGAGAKQVEDMSHFGELLGVAFQIKDDILDYTAKGSSGKLLCNDIKEHKITLPLICALQAVDNKTNKQIMAAIRNIDNDSNNIKVVRDFVIDNGGVEKASKMMLSYERKAIIIIDGYEDSIYKRSLINFANYILARNN